MEVVIASMAMLSIVFVAVSCVFGNRKKKIRNDRRMRMSVFIMFSAALLILADMLVSGSGVSLDFIILDLSPSAMSLWLLSSELSETQPMKWVSGLLYSFNPCLLAFHLCRLFRGLELPSFRFAAMLVSAMTFIMTILFIYGQSVRMRNMKHMMKNGTVWSVVCMAVDMVYLCFIVIGTAFLQLKLAAVGTLMIAGVVSATGLRILSDSKFVLWQKQETLIIESMKLTSVPSATDSARIEDVYKDLYERILIYFEIKKPYLDSDLTINNLVKDMYSNKMYISKAISQFTGRNFCQFVNYYRVMHSMECFRENQELKVHELAVMSGFNSVVSYSMAFRLFMGETPSEWFRKERSRLLKKGK